MKALALIIILVGAVLVVVGRFGRKTPVAIVGTRYSRRVAPGTAITLTRPAKRLADGPGLTTVRIREHADVALARDPA